MLKLWVTLSILATDRMDSYQEQRRSDEGATAVEYGLMVALIAVAIILIVTKLGTTLSNKFTDVCKAVNSNVAC